LFKTLATRQLWELELNCPTGSCVREAYILMKKKLTFICLFLALSVFASLAQIKPTSGTGPAIEYIDIIHCSHTDYGYTDHPFIVEELQQKFLDIAIDAALATNHLPAGQRFCWTAEALDIVWRWWKNATPERRSELIRLIESGQIDIAALPFNVHPFLNARQWDLALNWIPDELWEDFHPRVGIQHDVNGFSRASAIRLADKGIRYIWNGINTWWGGAPFPQPSGFWWKLPDGRKLLVWQSLPYWYGYNLFTRKDWRHVQAEASNTQFRTPRINDILPSDEASVREAHAICLEKIGKMKADGYPYDFIAVSITNQWRIDNDGPFPPLVDFINKWNELQLKPRLRLTTASDAMERIEKRVGEILPTFTGEWPDWWAFGVASVPRELAASRRAREYVEAALSPVWGGNDDKIIKKTEEITRSLCRFCEHTFAANEASPEPYGFFNQGHLAEKAIYAYRPYEEAKWLVAQRMRKLIANQPEGLYVVNSGEQDYTGWIVLDPVSFRQVDYRSVRDRLSGQMRKIYTDGSSKKFWIDHLAAASTGSFVLLEDTISDVAHQSKPEIRVDRNGWPTSVRWPGMTEPLFNGEAGRFLMLESLAEPRIEAGIWSEKDSAKRAGQIAQSTRQLPGTANEAAIVTETAHSIIYAQPFSHPRVQNGWRRMEVFKHEPRVSVTVHFFRLSSPNTEIFYIEFPMAETDVFPVTSNGGVEFRPYYDQIPGSCTDLFLIDGWVNYAAKSGSRLWSSRDAALISFSEPQLAAKRKTPPENMNKILAMVYNNMWEENFLNDCLGDMEFQFDLIWKDRLLSTREAIQITRSSNLHPLVMLNPATREDSFTFERMNEIK